MSTDADTDTAGNTILVTPDLSFSLIINSRKTPFYPCDQEFWEYIAIEPETALMIAQSFPNYWSDVVPAGECSERAATHRRAAMPQLAKASIPLPSLASLKTEEIAPTFRLLGRYNTIKTGWFDPETQYARYPFSILNELYPQESPQLSDTEWQTLLGDLFRLLYRSGHGRIHPEAVQERIPKRWVAHNSPLLKRFFPDEPNVTSGDSKSAWKKVVRWLKCHLTGKRPD